MEWISVKDNPPKDFELVMTKIEDDEGSRNEQSLKKCGNLWYTPNGGMYVYYTPTHWKHLPLPHDN